MIGLERVFYSPALRMKAGELNGIRDLKDDVAACVIPRFIVPPLGERDDKQDNLFSPGTVPDVGGTLSKYWVGRRAFIDLTYLIDEAGRENITNWLPQIFSRVRSLKVRGIPMAMLRDLSDNEAIGFKAAIPGDETLKFAICVASGEMVNPNFGIDLKAALVKLSLNPKDCAIITDFSDSDFSQPDHVAPIIGSALELLQGLGEWQHIIFQATHYPEKNPAESGKNVLCPRNEWAAWRQAVKFDPTTAEHLIFGDFAADSSKMVFGGAGAPAIRHYRYTTEEAWLVVRGEKTGSDKVIMKDVCGRIVASGHFAGVRFSTADAYIYRTANDLDGPGNSTMWRQVNTTHHITRVVTDVAKVRGILISEISEEPFAQQISLLE
ncbi:beta family protein [Massilia sp. YIM B04103]|uniref:beta family protein n=1 Tax=Massilia sp. YIM B04103 TaxID=2963106 RepID=UPI0021096447|nr:beta family protein [Massilia sp. YIM B04103]